MVADPKNARSSERIRHHYEVEKSLAAQLRSASREERLRLYGALYEQLNALVPDHPLVVHPDQSARRRRENVERIVRLLSRVTTADTEFLEVGSGDCMLTFEMAKQVRFARAVDVTDTLPEGVRKPANYELLLTDGIRIPVADGTIDVACSNQLMEHLHPDDALDQLKDICRVLVPGGKYLCITPSRLSGPHDISAPFDEVATGFHLKEYTIGELADLFRRAGFSRTCAVVGGTYRWMFVPVLALTPLETLVERLPPDTRRRATRTAIGKSLFGVKVLGIK